ncbi:MAG: VOC family protein [Gammaproteobacteria bacterium]|nr:VOC family protein [Gammaproteobacteria bacterium]
MAAVKFVPDGYHTATPYLILNDAAAEFYTQASDAAELMRLPDHSGKIGHAEIKIGNSVIMLADEAPDWGCRSPQSLGGTPVSIMLYVEDADTTFNRAVKAGAKPLRPMEDKFYGDRAGTLEDPYGHQWHLATHTEDLSAEALQQRFDAFMKQQLNG